MTPELSPLSVPNFISSDTPQGLRRAMLKTNARLGAWVRYFDVQQVTLNNKQTFIAWFYEPLKTTQDIEALNADT